MKKDRNSFFSQYGYSSYANNFMQPNMNMQPSMNMQPNMNMQQMPISNNPYNQNIESDLESRISKLERENKILESRISKLENSMPKITTNTDYNFANSMYMV